MEKYVIVKFIKNEKTGKEIPVILLDSQNEIMEFDDKDEAERIKNLFQVNSDSGHVYGIKRI